MIDEKDRGKLNQLIEKKRVNLETIKKEGLDKYANINYLYVADRTTLTELAKFWALNRSTVYRKFKKDIKKQVMLKYRINKLSRKVNQEKQHQFDPVELTPEKVFPTLSEYTELLKWRSNGNGKQILISVNNAAKALCTTERQVQRMIKNGKLHAFREEGNYKILGPSLWLHISNLIKELETKINKLNNFLHQFNATG